MFSLARGECRIFPEVCFMSGWKARGGGICQTSKWINTLSFFLSNYFGFSKVLELSLLISPTSDLYYEAKYVCLCSSAYPILVNQWGRHAKSQGCSPAPAAPPLHVPGTTSSLQDRVAFTAWATPAPRVGCPCWKAAQGQESQGFNLAHPRGDRHQALILQKGHKRPPWGAAGGETFHSRTLPNHVHLQAMDYPPICWLQYSGGEQQVLQGQH